MGPAASEAAGRAGLKSVIAAGLPPGCKARKLMKDMRVSMFMKAKLA